VLAAMSKTFPTADIYCLWNDAPGRFPRHRVTESVLARTPLRKSKAAALPFMPGIWGRVPLTEFDWTLVSSHLFAHHVGTPSSRAQQKMHVYVHTPARYIWTPELDKRGQNPVTRLVSPYYRQLDKRRAAEGAQFAANSAFVRNRIKDTWDQDARVIYPPVSVTKLQSVQSWVETLNATEVAQIERLPETYILGASRFVPYKQLENVIRAGESSGVPVVLAGSGPEEKVLTNFAEQASVPVYFVRAPSDNLLYALIQRALVFIFPPIEDFGILPVEAMALGTPAIVNSTGGAIESVAALDGGSAVETFEGPEIKAAVHDAATKDMSDAMLKAQIFSEESFSNNVRSWIDSSNNTKARLLVRGTET
jgi:glycosyltransferase involved in cell wall biosynthesis